jgi:hypothetical protein
VLVVIGLKSPWGGAICKGMDRSLALDSSVIPKTICGGYVEGPTAYVERRRVEPMPLSAAGNEPGTA